MRLRYCDTKTGILWEVRIENDEPYLYNEKLGRKVWDGGKHLVKI